MERGKRENPIRNSIKNRFIKKEPAAEMRGRRMDMTTWFVLSFFVVRLSIGAAARVHAVTKDYLCLL